MSPEVRKRRNAYCREWRRRNPDRVRAANMRWYANNRELAVERSKQYKRENPVSWERQKNWDLKKLYGMDLTSLNEMLKAQGGACAICRKELNERTAKVDHDHAKNKVRGILCHHCNLGIGQFFESKELLSYAISYLEKF